MITNINKIKNLPTKQKIIKLLGSVQSILITGSFDIEPNNSNPII